MPSQNMTYQIYNKLNMDKLFVTHLKTYSPFQK